VAEQRDMVEVEMPLNVGSDWKCLIEATISIARATMLSGPP